LMTKNATAPQIERLMELLGPYHDNARATARRLCRSHADGDDLFQETVLRGLDHLDELRDPERFRSWFFAVLISVHRARNRRDVWRRLLPLDEAGPLVDPAAGTTIDAISGAERMTRALGTLAPGEREAIVLFELGGFSLEEVAIRLPTHDPAQAQRRAALLRRQGATVTVVPRKERVWGSVYAMAKEKLLHVEINLKGKTEAQVIEELRAQLTQQV
jgi:RNA polymerase sigma factor (sigma-70 family)